MEQQVSEDEKQHNKLIEITVNARKKEWGKPEISFEEVVILAYGKFEEAPVIYTVTYRYQHKKGGELTQGRTVKVKKGMIFDVGRAHKS